MSSVSESLFIKEVLQNKTFCPSKFVDHWTTSEFVSIGYRTYIYFPKSWKTISDGKVETSLLMNGLI